VHGATPQKLATAERWRAEVAAQKAAEDAERREAAERGECALIDRVMFGDKCLERYKQQQKRQTP